MRLSQAQRELFHQHGYFINENGGAYLSGTSLGYTKKVEVASVYERAREDCGERPNISATALKGFLALGSINYYARSYHPSLSSKLAYGKSLIMWNQKDNRQVSPRREIHPLP
mmetsp:Transcript_15069/g.22596  ORF Transcript_15069/g.22596 Transcript_15069/m.22596 type:complete len:113 (+) Transcript_15069:103-441(+)